LYYFVSGIDLKLRNLPLMLTPLVSNQEPKIEINHYYTGVSFAHERTGACRCIFK
jgi:hypothetical protein